MSDVSYEESAEIEELAVQLKARYYEYIGHVDLDAIFFAEKIGVPPKKAKSEIQGNTSAWMRHRLGELGDTKSYCLSVWKSAWEEMSPAVREWTVLRLLYSVMPTNDGKLRKPNVQEFDIFLEYFVSIGLSVRWEEAVESLPSLLDSEDPLPIPLPVDDSDDGSTLDED